MTSQEDLMGLSLTWPDNTMPLVIGRRGAGVVGDACTVNALTPLGTPSLSIDTKPGGSTATPSGTTFTPDVAGLYACTLTNGGMTRKIEIVACPSQVKTYAPLNGVFRDFIERRVNERTSATAIANMSTTLPFPNEGGADTSVSWRPV